ncbi:RTC4-like domain-containing protein [Phyllosticta citriasiana]|uniref:Restriction of telomere capping protein 4 n=1 Tax=Phyllosticta citriasiana TaxID=595635 RepID=A0ABR1KTS2_9PEZI
MDNKPRRVGLSRLTPRSAPADKSLKQPPASPASTSQESSSPSAAKPAQRALTQAEIEAEPVSSSGEEEDEDESPKMNRSYSETLPAHMRPFKPPRPTQRKDGSKDSAVGGTKASLKRIPDSDFDVMEFGGPRDNKMRRSYASKNIFGRQKNQSTFSRPKNFHVPPKRGINSKGNARNAQDDGSDSGSESQPAPARKPLTNTTNTYKFKSLASPKSTKKAKGPAAKLHIIDDPDSLGAPVSSLGSNGVSPVRSIRMEDRGTPNSDLSSPPSSAQLEAEEMELEREFKVNKNGNYDQPAECPMCGSLVDADELECWQRRVDREGKSMALSDQILFCEAHKLAAARQEYSAHGYPEIDFQELPARVARFHDDLVGVLQETRPSHFRDRLNDAAAEGQGRTLAAAHNKDEMHGMTTGYYGPRGRRIMEDWVTNNLADAIRERAGSDRLIGFKTVSGFVQEVLVPELATWLVMEDRRESEDGEETGEARAREILGESAAIGDRVHAVKENGPGVARNSIKEVKVDDDGEDY